MQKVLGVNVLVRWGTASNGRAVWKVNVAELRKAMGERPTEDTTGELLDEHGEALAMQRDATAALVRGIEKLERVPARSSSTTSRKT